MPSQIVSFSDMDYRRDSPDSDYRRDDYRRQKLTDVEEEVDGTDVESIGRRSASPSPRKTRNYSVSSNMSMDTLWDLHPRRLSEAGLRRHSDTSVVLTEDTDCFIIGMRVWVGGTKPGQIAYIGETQFAPGDWAGIVLDEPIGKNDGSVSGTRYFQCEPKKGVFSRLTRLTLAPLTTDSVVMETSTSMRSPPSQLQSNGARKSVSPAGSTRSLIRPSTSLNTSTMSLSFDIKIGDRVIVQSSQGSKPGTLRYVGVTDFAKGEWCGVELDDPLGKNDGSVEGKRYFTCQPKFGLFAPIGKVSKSPSSRRPGGGAACVVHKATTPSGMSTPALRRQGSRESMSSMMSATSAASGVRRVRLGVTSLSSSAKKTISKVSSTPVSKSPLQDVIREKEHHIEQLLKEREIDRSEITRAATIAEKAEGKYLILQQEYEKYRLETEGKFKEHSTIVTELEQKLQQLSVQLEDEKKKLEDAQFRFEEENLNKDDIQAINKSQLERIKQLEEYLEHEKIKNEKLAEESKRLQESEQQLTKVQLELEQLRNAQDANNKNIQLKNTEILELKKKLDESKELLIHEQQRIKSKDKDIEMLNIEKEALLEEKEANIVKIKEELNASNKLLKESHFANELNLLKELKKAEMELSAKTFDCETNAEQVKQLQIQLQLLEKELQAAKTNEPETEKEKRLKASIEEIRTILKNTITELLRVRKEYALELLDKDISLREKDIALKYELNEIEKLKVQFNQNMMELTQNSKAYKERYNKQIENRNEQIHELLEMLQVKSKELIAHKMNSNKFEIELIENNVSSRKLKSQLEQLENKQMEQYVQISKLNDELKLAKLRSQEYERKYCNATETILQLKEIKNQHELKFKAMIEATSDSTGQLAILNEEIKKIETSLENTKTEMTKKLDACVHNEQQLKQTLELDASEHQREKKQLEEQIALLKTSELELSGKLQSLIDDRNAIQEQQQQQIVALTNKNYNNEIDLKAQIDANVDKVKELEQILEMAVNEHQQVQAELERRIEQVVTERDELRKTVKEKTALVVESEEQLKQHLVSSDSMHEKQIHQLRNDIEQYQLNIKEMKQQLEEITALKKINTSLEEQVKKQSDQINSLNEENAKFNGKQLENEEKQKQLVQQMNALNEVKHKLEQVINEHQVKITTLEEQLKKMQDENANISNTILERDEKINGINEQVQKLNVLINEKDSCITEKENNMKALQQQLEQIIKEKGTTSETFAIQEKKIMDLNMEIQKLTQEKSTLATTVQTKDNELLQLKETLTSIENNLKEKVQIAEGKHSELEQQIQTLKKQQQETQTTIIVQKDEHITNLQKQIDVLTTKNNDINAEKEDINQKLQQFKENQSTSDKTLNELQITIKEKEKQIEAFKLELETWNKKWENPIENATVQKLNETLKNKEILIEKNIAEIKVFDEKLNQAIKDKTQNDEKILSLEKQLNELLKEKNNLNDVLKTKDNELKTIKDSMGSEKQEITTILKQKEDEISELKKQYNRLQQEKTNEINKIKTNEENIAKLKSDIEILNKDKLELNATIKENNEKLLKLNEQVQQSGDNDVQQSMKMNELENAIKQKDAQLIELNKKLEETRKTKKESADELQQKLNEKENELKEKMDKVNTLNVELEKFEKENHELQRTWKTYMQQWKIKLMNLENIRKIAADHCDTLEQQVKLLQSQNESNLSKDQIKTVNFDEFKKEIDLDSGELYKALDKAQQLVIEREKELNHVRNTSLDLQKQLEQMEKKIIEVTTMNKQKSGIPKPKDKETTCDMDTYKKMLEEKEFAIGQVEFLNSIIVDMKQKNEELQSKIEILENGYVDVEDTTGTNNLQDKMNRVIPPRQYCDICEVFDLHETEDCPVQMTDDAEHIQMHMQPQQQQQQQHQDINVNVNRVLPEPRPYCEICEEFGHNTENCDADETY